MTDITELTGAPKHANQHRISRIIVESPNDELRQMTVEVEQYTDQLIEALEKAQTKAIEQGRTACELFVEVTALRQRIAELESRTVTAPQNDYFASLVALARVSADKAMKKFPQPNYVLLKVAEEAGEVVQAGVHYAENRMEWKQVEGEIVQLLAMLIRLVTEGDQINGVTPPASCAAGIKVEAE
ncbi:hypothetical protein [Klebsiella variicola]|uniref:hypothetical protein n=1 Tax=Klebsiella variicola TaxID=244366 RepID=UPI0021C3934D|nr:hypothetical protein [Klebsiella variicola]